MKNIVRSTAMGLSQINTEFEFGVDVSLAPKIGIRGDFHGTTVISHRSLALRPNFRKNLGVQTTKLFPLINETFMEQRIRYDYECCRDWYAVPSGLAWE